MKVLNPIPIVRGGGGGKGARLSMLVLLDLSIPSHVELLDTYASVSVHVKYLYDGSKTIMK